LTIFDYTAEMKPAHVLLAALSIFGARQPASAQKAESMPDPLSQSTQMIAVTTEDWNAVNGQLQQFERDTPKQAWRLVGKPISVVVGKHGLGWGVGLTPIDDPASHMASDPIKQEGDSKAPAGIFALGTAFGYAPTSLPESKMPYLALTPATECVDDTASKQYNQIVERSTVLVDWKSSEHMRSEGESYRWGVVVDHNGAAATNSSARPIPGRGSCIFLHIWKGTGDGTVGCTAMPQPELETVIRWLDPKRNPVLVQLPEQKYLALATRWKLPPPAAPPTH
jgi:L,D-peptidoglycan transpeptidase YkuD (ErfK/YbiS/YcfS/YnhG family)